MLTNGKGNFNRYILTQRGVYMGQLEQLFNILTEFDSEIEILINEQNELHITSNAMGYEHCFETNTDGDIDELKEEIDIFVKSKKIEIAFQEITPNIEIEWYGDDEIIANSSDWDKEIYLELNDEYKTVDDLIGFVNKLKTYNYVECESCYENDYVEYIVSFKDWKYDYLKYKLYGIEDIETKIIYEISPISQELLTLIRINERYDMDEFYDEDLITLKIKNINSVIGISVEDECFHEKCEQIAKSIIFDISRKYGVDIYLSHFICSYLDLGDEIYSIQDEVIEKRCIFTNDYDKDLVEYYYEAMQMDISEFQYMAFYRVIECIFDEVYKYETIQDVKYIINSDTFSSYDDKDIINIVDIVEKYQKQKNDREKIRLVFEKYLKGTIRDEAFYIVNKDLIKILKDDLNMIKREEELKDCQKIGNIIYDFRCRCTHSNRAFNYRGNFDDNLEELEKYINLIKKICQRIIVNYSVSSIN